MCPREERKTGCPGFLCSASGHPVFGTWIKYISFCIVLTCIVRMYMYMVKYGFGFSTFFSYLSYARSNVCRVILFAGSCYYIYIIVISYQWYILHIFNEYFPLYFYQMFTLTEMNFILSILTALHVKILQKVKRKLLNLLLLNYMFWSDIHATTVHVSAGVHVSKRSDAS